MPNACHYAELVAAAKRNPSLIPNHRDRLLPLLRRRLKEIDGALLALSGATNSKVLSKVVDEFAGERRRISGYIAFYEKAKSLPAGAGATKDRDVNPRYVAFCRAHGRTVKEQRAHDERRWPGGVMCGFILWIRQMEQEFRRKHPEAYCGHYITDHDAWTRFLEREGRPLEKE